MKKSRFIALLIPILLSCSNGVSSKEPGAAKPGETSPPMRPTLQSFTAPSEDELARLQKASLTTANQDFGFKLMVELFRSAEKQNLVLSPLSAAQALAMTLQGAKADTREAMLQALSLKGITPEDIRRLNLILRKRLAHPPTGVELAVANSIWGKQGLQYQAAFLQANQDYFGAKLATLDFNAAQAPTQINTWVKEQTNSKITQVIQTIEPLTVMLLINALYFKGQWTTPFDSHLTETRNFNLLNQQTKRVPMMSRSGTFTYLRNTEQQFQAVALPYGPDEQLKMYVFLPDPESSLKTFVQTLSTANWKQWQTGFKTQAGDVVLPKFKLNGEAVLNDPLRILGMGIAFESGNANFTDLINDPAAYISKVKQNTFLDVNEQGSEAAAATTVIVKTRSMAARPPGEPFNFVADRPFLVVIYDERVQSLLFIATINEP